MLLENELKKTRVPEANVCPNCFRLIVPEEIIIMEEPANETKIVKSNPKKRLKKLAEKLLQGKLMPINEISQEDQEVLKKVMEDENEIVINAERINSVLEKFYNPIKCCTVKRVSNINLVKRILILNPSLDEEYRKQLSDFVLDEEKSKTMNITEILANLPKETIFIDPVTHKKISKLAKIEAEQKKTRHIHSAKKTINGIKKLSGDSFPKEKTSNQKLSTPLKQIIKNKIVEIKTFYISKKLKKLTKTIKNTEKKLTNLKILQTHILLQNTDFNKLFSDVVKARSFSCLEKETPNPYINEEEFDKLVHISKEAIVDKMIERVPGLKDAMNKAFGNE